MKKNLKALLAFCLYRVELLEPVKMKNDMYRWRFRMYPRKLSMILFFFLIIPIILLVGILHYINAWKEYSGKIQDWSSYQMILSEGEKPKIWDCYKRF